MISLYQGMDIDIWSKCRLTSEQDLLSWSCHWSCLRTNSYTSCRSHSLLRAFLISQGISMSRSWTRSLWPFTLGLARRYLSIIYSLLRPLISWLQQQQLAQQILTQFQEHPDAWTRVPEILERSSYPQTKVCLLLWLFLVFLTWPASVQYIGLQILEKLILTRWKSLPDGQRQGPPRYSHP